ncbi:uncharacterized protein [Labrus bergylta]|uniref:uncharacterized protein n=1 Tax=Labrus bergylta TaxID=56723 RepID=UPI003314378D
MTIGTDKRCFNFRQQLQSFYEPEIQAAKKKNKVCTMKFLLLIMFTTTFCFVNADKSHRTLAAIMAGMNGGMANGVIPVRVAGGLNPSVVAVGGAGLVRQTQFVQIVPGVPAYAAPAPVSNVYTVPAVNTFPFMGVPQTRPINPLQQPLMGVTGGVLQQQLQPDPFRRFKRQVMNQANTFETTVDTQIPAPTETTKPTPCKEKVHLEEDIVEDSF